MKDEAGSTVATSSHIPCISTDGGAELKDLAQLLHEIPKNVPRKPPKKNDKLYHRFKQIHLKDVSDQEESYIFKLSDQTLP